MSFGVIGGALASAVAGTVVNATIGKALGGGGGGGGQAQVMPPSESMSTTVLNSKTASTTGRVTLRNDTKVAKAAKPMGVKYKTYGTDKDDPWANTRDWYTNLGGDPENVEQINEEDMPF